MVGPKKHCTENFFGPNEGEWENSEFEIEIVSTGAIIQVAPDEKATEALKNFGISVDVKCSDGLCGVCSTKYLSGEVEHRHYVLSKSQKGERMILCCSRAKAAGGRIKLDL